MNTLIHIILSNVFMLLFPLIYRSDSVSILLRWFAMLLVSFVMNVIKYRYLYILYPASFFLFFFLFNGTYDLYLSQLQADVSNNIWEEVQINTSHPSARLVSINHIIFDKLLELILEEEKEKNIGYQCKRYSLGNQ